MLKIVFPVLACLALSSCTISISQINIEGSASDVIDQDQKADADISPDVSLPLAKKIKRPSAKDTGYCEGCKIA